MSLLRPVQGLVVNTPPWFLFSIPDCYIGCAMLVKMALTDFCFENNLFLSHSSWSSCRFILLPTNAVITGEPVCREALELNGCMWCWRKVEPAVQNMGLYSAALTQGIALVAFKCFFKICCRNRMSAHGKIWYIYLC